MENKLVWTDDVLTAYQAGFGKELSITVLKLRLRELKKHLRLRTEDMLTARA